MIVAYICNQRMFLLLYITYELVVNSVNNRGPHGGLACILLNV